MRSKGAADPSFALQGSERQHRTCPLAASLFTPVLKLLHTEELCTVAADFGAEAEAVQVAKRAGVKLVEMLRASAAVAVAAVV